VHVNHPRELTIEVKQALERLANAGIPLGNQSVLLAGVNDDLENYGRRLCTNFSCAACVHTTFISAT